MEKLAIAFLAGAITLSASAFGQYSTSPAPEKSQDATKAVSVAGKIADDGKTFVSDKDGKSWTIVNPDAVKGHEGHHVVLKAHVYPDKGEIHVMSLKMAKESTGKDSKPDSY
jgi:hypothetical protein